VISHSISIDLPSLEKAKRIATGKESDEEYDPATGKHGPRMDPHGAFTVTFDRATWEIVVEHSFEGMKLGEYRGKNTEEIERQIARDVAISEISHALYLGRELARKEFEMKAERAQSAKGL
jgi:thymidylate synthase